jgi:hypothetical protein
MNAIGRRLRALERRLAPLRPPAVPAWIRWTTHAELDDLEERYRLAAEAGRELTELDVLRVIEVEAAATRRMLAGEPPA